MTEPRTKRGHATRSALLAAARETFEQVGFLDAKVADFTQRARVASGTFYTYFADKEAVFAAVAAEVEDEMLGLGPRTEPGETPRQHLHRANAAYFDSYRRNRGLMAVFEQVATINEEFREVRRRRAKAFAERNAKYIKKLQADGLADPTLDPMLASVNLGAMVSRTAYLVFVLEILDADFDALVESATTLWINALCITEPKRGRR